MPHTANVAYDVNYVKAWAWHRHHEKCPRQKDRHVLQGNFTYASAARRRTCGGNDGDGGGGGSDGGSGVSLRPRWIVRISVNAFAGNCSHLISRDFNATIKRRFAGRIKEINAKAQSSGGFVGVDGGRNSVAGGRDADVGGFVQIDAE